MADHLNNVAETWRNAANTADVNAITVDSSNRVVLAGTNSAATMYVGAAATVFGKTVLLFGEDSTHDLRFTSSGASSSVATVRPRITAGSNGLDVYVDTTLVATYTSGGLNAPLVQNAQTGTSYTLVLGDAGKLVELSNASAITLTVPPNTSVAFPVGTQINLLQTNTGQVTVNPGSGVTVNGSPGLKLTDRWSAATLIKRATDTWVLVGRLSA